MTMTPAQWMGVREGMLSPEQEEQVRGIRQYQDAKRWADAVDEGRTVLGVTLASLPPTRWLLNAKPRTQKIVFAVCWMAMVTALTVAVILGVTR